MNGLLLLDKPRGLTSFDIVRKVRRWCGTRQVGHCGTLDPSATGVLPVTVGSATRLVEYLMAGDKEYLATMRLGVITDTQDADGRVVETRSWQHVDSSSLAAVVSSFIGTTRQIPPMHSALKRDGVPLYRLARQGMSVEREPREVRIDALEVLSVELPDVTLRISCSKGTYVRTLCHDMGMKLGCGAHMSTLRRTRCGTFAIEQCHAVEECEAAVLRDEALPLLTPAEALAEWPGLQVQDGAVHRLANGVAPLWHEVIASPVPAAATPVRLLVNGQLAAVACYAPGGHEGRSGDFHLWKVFPEAFRLP